MKENERPTRILVECPQLIASVRVGVLDALKPLEGKTCETRFSATRSIKKADLQWCDILICVRGSELMTKQIVLEAKRLKRIVVYFLDDDLLHLPKESLSFAYFQYADNQRSMIEILEQSDALWGVNERIKEQYLPLCGKQRWVCSRVPAHVSSREKRPNKGERIRVLYAGSVDHQNLIRELLANAVQRVIERCGDKVEFVFVGPDPQLKRYPQVRYQRFFESYEEYRAFVEEGAFDIGLAPTRPDGFFQCKYYNKFVEYASIGAAGIYTDCQLYRQVVKNRENGLLCDNTPEEWADAIIELAEDAGFRERCRKTAADLLRKEFTPDAVAQSVLRQIPEIEQYRAPKVEIRKIRLVNPWLYFYFTRSRYLFHQYHLLAVPIIGYKAIKKMAKWLIMGVKHIAQ